MDLTLGKSKHWKAALTVNGYQRGRKNVNCFIFGPQRDTAGNNVRANTGFSFRHPHSQKARFITLTAVYLPQNEQANALTTAKCACAPQSRGLKMKNVPSNVYHRRLPMKFYSRYFNECCLHRTSPSKFFIFFLVFCAFIQRPQRSF